MSWNCRMCGNINFDSEIKCNCGFKESDFELSIIGLEPQPDEWKIHVKQEQLDFLSHKGDHFTIDNKLIKDYINYIDVEPYQVKISKELLSLNGNEIMVVNNKYKYLFKSEIDRLKFIQYCYTPNIYEIKDISSYEPGQLWNMSTPLFEIGYYVESLYLLNKINLNTLESKDARNVMFQKGVISYHMGFIDDSKSYFQPLKSTLCLSWIHLGDKFLEKDNERAIQYYGFAVESWDKDINMNYIRGKIAKAYQNIGKFEEAEEQYKLINKKSFKYDFISNIALVLMPAFLSLILGYFWNKLFFFILLIYPIEIIRNSFFYRAIEDIGPSYKRWVESNKKL